MSIQFKKALAGVIAAVALVLPSGASGAGQAVVVIAKDGTQHQVALADVDRMDIGTDRLTLSDRNGGSKEVAYADLDRVLIGADASSISEIVKPGEIAVWPTRVETAVNISGLGKGAVAKVYDLGGALRGQGRASSEGDVLTIDLSGAEAGVYIVNVENHSVKIIKN